MSETAEQEWNRLQAEFDEADALRPDPFCEMCGTPLDPGERCLPCLMTLRCDP